MPIQKTPNKAKSKKSPPSKPAPSKTVIKNQKAPVTPSISSEKRLEDILAETEAELASIQPQIEKLEQEVDRLKTLKLTKQKLITLKLSIQSILGNYGTRGESFTTDVRNKESSLLKNELTSSQDLVSGAFSESYQKNVHLPSNSPPHNNLSLSGEGSEHMFLPDVAFRQVKQVLKQKNSLNYEIFRAIVFQGGQATTEEIKEYLIANDIKQPTSGEGFEHVEMTDISSRVNYLVRKEVVTPLGRGHFRSNFGWQSTEAS